MNIRDFSSLKNFYDDAEKITLEATPPGVDKVERHFYLLSFLNTGRPVSWRKLSFLCFLVFRFLRFAGAGQVAMRWHARAGRLYVAGH
jgi:hypothetical protein